MELEETLQAINARVERLGDLPIFSATVNRIRMVSTSVDTDAMALAMEVMKDANLTTKLLRLANSSYYNRGAGRISVVSRAVVLLGFDTIKNLCITLKLIDSFQSNHPNIDMNGMLVNAYLSAGLVREVAGKCGVRDIEETYVCALLHRLGEIIVAYFLPEKFEDMQEMRRGGEASWEDIQKEMLGGTFADVGQHMARTWEFPSHVVQTMSDYRAEGDRPLADRHELNHALATLAHSALDTIYSEGGREQAGLSGVLSKIANAAGVEPNVIEGSLTTTFRMACDLAQDYGLDRKVLIPPVEESDDGMRDKMARMFSYYASTRSARDMSSEELERASKEAVADAPAEPPQGGLPPPVGDGAGDPDAPAAVPPKEGDLPGTQEAGPDGAESRDPRYPGGDRMRVQLDILQQITSLITESAGVHRVFSKVVEGAHRGVSLERVMLCLVSADHSVLSGRIALGPDADSLKEYFAIPLRQVNNLFIRVLLEGSDLQVSDSREDGWQHSLPEDFFERVGATSFVISSMRLNDRPVGLFYADNAVSKETVSPEQYRGFLQFVNQAKLALQYSELCRTK